MKIKLVFGRVRRQIRTINDFLLIAVKRSVSKVFNNTS